MLISTLSVRRPVVAAVCSTVILVFGLISFLRLEVRQYPDVDAPVVSISTSYRGASAAVVDAEVTKRLLDRLSGIEGIRTIESNSSDGNSRINIEFVLSRDLDLAAADVRDEVNRARDDLPLDADEPIVRKASSDSSPIMWLSLTSDRLNSLELTDFASRRLEERLSLLDGVSRVRIGGERRYAMRIWLDPDAMAARGLTVADIESRLEAENIELPSGRLESRLRELSVRSVTRLQDADEFRQLIIRRTPTGPIRLGDVARVDIEAEDDRSAFSVNSQTSVSLGIIRQSNANTVDVTRAVRAEVEVVRATLPDGVDIRIASDDSIFIRASIREVGKTLAIAMGLVVLVIIGFLRSVRATLVPALAIPVSVLGTVTMLYAAGFSINVLTLLAAVLAIGLVVDDSIVVLENIERRISNGEPRLAAAARGASEVGFAVIATTIVLVAVFVPLAFLTGRVGRLFTEFGLTLAGAVVISSFTALTLGVMLSSQVIRPRRKKAPKPAKPVKQRKGHKGKPEARVPARPRRTALDLYGAAVGVAIRFRWASVIVAIAITLAASFFYNRLPRELTPVEDQGRFIVALEAPEGSSLQYTKRQTERVEEILAEFRGEGQPIDRVISIVAPGFGGANQVNTARIIVRLVDWSERDITQQDLVAKVGPRLRAIPGARIIPINPAGFGIRGAGEPINYAIGGPDFESALQWAQIVADRAGADPIFEGLRLDFAQTQPQLSIKIDRERAIDLGIDVRTIGRTLQTFLGGREVTEFFDRGELYKVLLQARPEARVGPTDLSNIYIRSDSGSLILLSTLVRLEESGTVRDLTRINRVPSVVLTGSVAPGSSLGAALDRLDEIVRDDLPPGASVNYLGESLEYRDASMQLFITFGLALLLVYLALAAQFESLVHPFTILVAVPLAVTGGLATLWITGNSLNIYSQIGLILLIGLMAKNGILMVEFANQLRGRGRSLQEAAREAAMLRFRPIMMTVISTVLGAIPLVLASGAGAEGRRAIGLVIVGGMSFATLLTLFLIPSLYTLLGMLTQPTGATERKLREQLAIEGHADDKSVPAGLATS
ncbi:MAG: efflux RND transporter permease subunit [Phycisphaerales bacterium]|nr:MAG: efflux RND transporter permease subunit [Phycisphaerales bacterium]